ncbi:hypothetical protein Osc1_14510 [Hominimerdicola sp. 21CYCFAH17_S]
MWKEKFDMLSLKKRKYGEEFNKGVSETDMHNFKETVKKH